MFQELIRLTQDLEKDLCESKGSVMHLLQPQFCLIGSMAERTRLGLPTEVDLSMVFRAWKGKPPFKIEEDAFSLKMSEGFDKCHPWMKKYVSDKGTFNRSMFMKDILVDTEVSVRKIFGNEKIITTNEEHLSCSKCTNEVVDEKGRFKKQNRECCVLVSQSKIGICLQLLLTNNQGTKAYCSIDLIPMFEVETILDADLFKITNEGMLKIDHPRDWSKYFYSYCNTLQMIDLELGDSDVSLKNLTQVTLKVVNCYKDKNYFVKPGQILGGKKFQNKGMRKVYCYLKALKKILAIDVSSFWIKKMLMSRHFSEIANGWGEDLPEYILYDVLNSTEFKHHFSEAIEFATYELQEDMWMIPRKGCLDIPLD